MLAVLAVLGFVLFIVSLVGVGQVYSHRREKNHYLYTTADESNTIFSRGEVLMMSSVCITNPQQQQVLHTSNCDSVHKTRKGYNFSDNEVQPGDIDHYYFAFAEGSHVTVTFAQHQEGTASVKYSMEKDPEKATKLYADCNEGQGIPPTVFHEDGYYCICIINSGDTPLTYTMAVSEHYYHREITNECNDTIYHDGAKHVCCHFGLSETSAHHHCVYLTTRNTDPQHLEKPESVKVYITYSETMKTLTIIGVVSAIIIGLVACFFFVPTMYHCYAYFRVRLLNPR